MAEEQVIVNRKTLVGNVLSGGKMQKTVTVSIERITKHPFYGKYVKRRVKFAAHDEKNECKTGDKVLIVETRPLSKTKRWRVQQILEKAR
ncbi:MAG: 30S ribosomal protein S17 [Deltaproteobacteria bacterium RIFCSPLOWO2_02_FULL_53_8]|nr:MAG: 30S ribosomal protein S17 [Deltaproteobacteria bacterium RIFCSPLOWO2_02_FULL_53_8]